MEVEMNSFEGYLFSKLANIGREPEKMDHLVVVN
jgi:hypothetical protein